MQPVSDVDKRRFWFKNKLKQKKSIIAKIGLGYVGLPLSMGFNEAGLSVIGFDINRKIVDIQIGCTSFV